MATLRTDDMSIEELDQLVCGLRLELAVLRGRLSSNQRLADSVRTLEELSERIVQVLADRRKEQ
jgi:hypothetical protein